MLALLASSASAAYKMHLYEGLACTDAPWEISFEGSTCIGNDPFLWTDGDGDLGNGYYFKNGFRTKIFPVLPHDHDERLRHYGLHWRQYWQHSL